MFNRLYLRLKYLCIFSKAAHLNSLQSAAYPASEGYESASRLAVCKYWLRRQGARLGPTIRLRLYFHVVLDLENAFTQRSSSTI